MAFSTGKKVREHQSFQVGISEQYWEPGVVRFNETRNQSTIIRTFIMHLRREGIIGDDQVWRIWSFTGKLATVEVEVLLIVIGRLSC